MAPLAEQTRGAALSIDDPRVPFIADIDLQNATQCQLIPLPDGPISPGIDVLDDKGMLVGTVLLWIEQGLLFALEYAWYTDDMPSDWPHASQLRAG